MARDIRHPYSLMLALTFAGRIHYCRRDAQAVATLVEETIAVCSEHHFPYYLAQANIQRGWAWTRMGHEAKGISEMRRGMSGLSATGTALGRAGAFIQLAEAYDAAGFAEDALGVLDEAADSTSSSGSRYWDAEIARLRGVVALSLNPSATQQAKKCFSEAMEIARGQSIRSFELRSAMDLARLWQSEGKNKAAFDLVSNIYNWFEEGFDTADLQAAKALLNELA